MKILSIDQSTTAPGVCRYVDGRFEIEEWEIPKHSKKSPVLTEDRLDIIEFRLKVELVERGPFAMVVLEAPAYGANGRGHAASMGLYWKLRCVVHKLGVHFQEVEPSRVKLWAVGNGKAEKSEMISAAQAYFTANPPAAWTDNMADAAWIAHLSAVVWGDAEFPDFDSSTLARQYVYAVMTGHPAEGMVLHKRLTNERKANAPRRVAA